MATFHYKAHRADQTLFEGRIDADDLKAARLSLENQGLLVASIHQVEVTADEEFTPSVASPAGQPTEPEELALQSQINRVLKIEKPLAPALLAYAQELPRGRRRLRLQRIAGQLEQGHGSPLELDVGQIDKEWIPILIAAAAADDPSQIPIQIIDEIQRTDDLRAQFTSALAYPLILLTVSLAILSFISWWIIPAFQEMFTDFGLNLPAPTQLVLALSQAIREFWWVVLLTGLLLAAILFYVAGFRDWILHHIPIFGSTVRLADRARFTRYLADLMEAGVKVTDALRISGRTTGQPVLHREANQLATAMDAGGTDLGTARALCQNLPHTVVHALQFQANPKAAARILRELSWMYGQQTSNRLAWFASLAEPVLIIFLGATVGFYVVALFIPFISLIRNLS